MGKIFEREIRDSAKLQISSLQLQTEKGNIIHMRTDHGGEFQNEEFKLFCQEQGIVHQFSSPRTPQQNGVVERKNMMLQEMARAMMLGNHVATRFWAEAVNTACYIINRVYVKPGSRVTPYEIWKGKSKKPQLLFCEDNDQTLRNEHGGRDELLLRNADQTNW